MTFYIKLKMSTSWYHYKNFYYNIIKKTAKRLYQQDVTSGAMKTTTELQSESC